MLLSSDSILLLDPLYPDVLVDGRHLLIKMKRHNFISIYYRYSFIPQLYIILHGR